MIKRKNYNTNPRCRTACLTKKKIKVFIIKYKIKNKIKEKLICFCMCLNCLSLILLQYFKISLRSILVTQQQILWKFNYRPFSENPFDFETSKMVLIRLGKKSVSKREILLEVGF